MNQTIFGIIPYEGNFYDEFIRQISRVLNPENNEDKARSPPIDQIELEIKFAIPKRNMPISNTVIGLSKQNIINLNPLGILLQSNFDEHTHRKFYHMKQFLGKLSAANKSDHPSKHGFYSHYRNVGLNKQILVKEANQIRMDIFLSQYELGVNKAMAGRYSFSTFSGWIKTQKKALCEQMDMMLNSNLFRLAINYQSERKLEQFELVELSRIMDSQKNVDIRLKKTFTAVKGKINEFALSQILAIRDLRNCDKLTNIIREGEPPELAQYCQRIFCGFFSQGSKEMTKFEVQSQLTKEHLQYLQKLLRQGKKKKVENQIKTAIEDLCNLFFCDHSRKVFELSYLNGRCKELSQAHQSIKLENEFGTYMKDIMYDDFQDV